MMATPQQPVYPHDLNLALDRHFTKFTNYTSARYEELAAQVRIGNEESLMRDTDLVNAILRLTERVSNIETRVSNIENTQQAIIKTLGTLQEQMAAMQEQIKDGFAAQAERHNELMVRVEKLERNEQN